MVDERTPDVVGCGRARRFWLSWQAGDLRLSLVAESGTTLLSWHDAKPLAVHAVGMVTGLGNEGEWIFAKNQGKLMWLTPDTEVINK